MGVSVGVCLPESYSNNDLTLGYPSLLNSNLLLLLPLIN